MNPEVAAVSSILGMRISVISMPQVVNAVMRWACEARTRVICLANVHMTMEAHDNPELQALLNTADMTLPDGMPLVWASKLSGFTTTSRIRGPNLMLQICQRAAEHSVPLGLYGGRPGEPQEKLTATLSEAYSGLNIAISIAPPFRPLTVQENDAHVQALNRSGARIVFVGIGCPKQEVWMLENRPRLHAVLIGVGAAFDLLGGKTRNAPLWMQDNGLEWLFRLLSEPKRLWKRYLKHNPRFVWLFLRQWLRQHRTLVPRD